jgi:ABC-type lipoprotein release transport system permease subunit
MIFLLAFRNIIRNKKNSCIVLLLIGVITLLFFIGNTIIAQSSRGLHSFYTKSLTGDIVLEKSSKVTMSLFGANAPHLEDFFLMEILPAYNNLTNIVSSLPEVESWTSIVSTGAFLQASDKTMPALLTGIDAKNYFSIFSNIEINRGHFLANGEAGIMINHALATDIEAATGKPLEIGMPITLTTSGKVGFKIREIPLAGIFSYHAENTILNNITLVDAQTVRALSSIRVATGDVTLSQETEFLLNNENFENLFNDTSYSSSDTVISLHDNILDYFNQNQIEVIPSESTEGGDWNFVLIKLAPNFSIPKTIKKLNSLLEPYNVTAVDWRTAAGIAAIFVFFLQTLYNAGIFIVCFAGVIAIVNILLIAVFKRTREIGTLRAIGASDNYIRLLLICENSLLGFVGGLFGILLGVIALSIINTFNITITNTLIVNLLGIKTLQISFFPEYALMSLLFSVVLSFLAILFPIKTAIKIEPVIAVREG